MHNLNYQQIIVIGAAIVFGGPAMIGIVAGRLYSLEVGVFAGLFVFVLILAISWTKLKAMASEQKGKGEGDNERHDTETH